MDKKELQNLYVFGYGIALMIPFLMSFHALHLSFGFLNVVFLLIGFAVVMAIITKISTWKPVANLWIFVVQIGVVLFKIRTGFGIVAIILLGAAAVVLGISIARVTMLKPVYTGWMRVAHGIGAFLSGVILTVLFYICFAPVGLLLRVLRKDLLDQNLEPDKESYWIRREESEFDKERYTKQF